MAKSDSKNNQVKSDEWLSVCQIFVNFPTPKCSHE